MPHGLFAVQRMKELYRIFCDKAIFAEQQNLLRSAQPTQTPSGAMPLDVERDQDLCADHQGFSLHAAVRCDADERQRLEQLCRYVTALANERVQINSAGQVVLKLKTAWRDGTTHIVMSPLQFMQRLAARANEGRLSGTRAPAQAAPDPTPWGAGAQCQATGHGGAARPRAGHRQIGAHRDRARLRAWPAGAHQLGPAAQARV